MASEPASPMAPSQGATVHHASPERLLDEHETSHVLALKVATLRRWRWAHKGPAFIKLGGSVRYRRADLDAFMEANRHAPAGAVPDAA